MTEQQTTALRNPCRAPIECVDWRFLSFIQADGHLIRVMLTVNVAPDDSAVWMSSAAILVEDRPLPVYAWNRSQRELAAQAALYLLKGVGDEPATSIEPARISLTFHRPCTPAERQLIPGAAVILAPVDASPRCSCSQPMRWSTEDHCWFCDQCQTNSHPE